AIVCRNVLIIDIMNHKIVISAVVVLCQAALGSERANQGSVSIVTVTPLDQVSCSPLPDILLAQQQIAESVVEEMKHLPVTDRVIDLNYRPLRIIIVVLKLLHDGLVLKQKLTPTLALPHHTIEI